LKILGIFLLASVLYVLWIVIFLKRRKALDYKRFAQASAEQSNLYQLITGMQEIKLNNCEKQKRWEWEHIQTKLFKVSVKGLSLSQYQQAGGFFINEAKNIIISFFAAQAVITGNMTLGMMLAVQYIIGQLNSPISQLIGFVQAAQDAKISLERLGEISNKEDEEPADVQKITTLPSSCDIHLHNVLFQYDGPHSEIVLQDITMDIPQGKTTAIVGMSGSGKTTLVKLLLGFYPPVKGEIFIGGNIDAYEKTQRSRRTSAEMRERTEVRDRVSSEVQRRDLRNFHTQLWRNSCGAVMQDGFIFSDTIARNIAIGDEVIDKARLQHAVKTANIAEMIEGLPLGYNTKIGQEGHGLSQGQKQRILIARVVYKNPQFIFFDEATNALDANNERVIMENLEEFFKGRTVVIVAHRLSTVKNADNIVVLDKGRIVEQGTHAELTQLRGAYFELVKNQLELGS
ncbi:MAG: ATP-binding cassette domain-containing protein, partial [Bacteroidales bacterium]|nr:ATP-binding cassette domain-containing protein [Bacteroidales bacterium]